MDQSDLSTGGNLFRLDYPPGPIVNSPGFLVIVSTYTSQEKF